MSGWPEHPVIYEINTAVWLDEGNRSTGRRRTLADITPVEWDTITPTGVDAVWLMGVWERSPAGTTIARRNPALLASFDDALPDLNPEDVIGSPYCVRRYEADQIFGGPNGLAAARAALAERGVRLVLDYVPNHVAPDHPWTIDHPESFVRGDQGRLEREPTAWLAVGDSVIARGRDPYFPPWPDVLQLDAFAPALRAATVDILSDIAGQCDGIRCDMAMLMMNDVFSRTWGGQVGPPPAEEFWTEVVPELRARHPGVVLLAEAYWDREWDLQQQGFDFCYDKRLYDRLTAADAPLVRQHLLAPQAYQTRLVRFVENHDEPRVASVLPEPAQRANLVAWAWTAHEGDQHVVVVNLSATPAQGRVWLGRSDLGRGEQWLLTELLDGGAYNRSGDELEESGLFVDLLPWGFHLLRVRAASTAEVTV